MRITKDKVKKLINKAQKALLKNKESQFAAAILTSCGNIYVGIPFRSESETLTVHAEHAAIVNANTYGEKEIIALATVAKVMTDYPFPCAICRQILHEIEIKNGNEITIIAAKSENDYQTIRLSELYPSAWP